MEAGFQRFELFPGIRLFVRATHQFKTITVDAVWHHHLGQNADQDLEEVEARATKAALLPFVLKRGTESYPETTALARRLEELFGADLDVDVSKRGERQLVRFRLEVANPKFLPRRFRMAEARGARAAAGGDVSGDRLLADALKVLGEVMFRPAFAGDAGLFRDDYFEQERDKLARLLESRINDKVSYATERCVEEMFAGQPYAVYRYGTISALRRLDVRGMTEFYRSFAESAPLDLFVVGDVDPERVSGLIREALLETGSRVSRSLSSSLPVPEAAGVGLASARPRTVEETMDVAQAKVSLGLLTGIGYRDLRAEALAVYNGILGGGAHSKLFQYVREKASLAYYAFARLERFKGAIVIGAGIETANYEKALAIIREQLDEMRAGHITDYEYDATIKAIVNAIRVSGDSPGGPIEILLDGLVGGEARDPEEIIRRIQGVTKEDVAAVAQEVTLDTIYFLHGGPTPNGDKKENEVPIAVAKGGATLV